MVEPIHANVKGRTRYKVEGLYRSDSFKRYLEHKLSEKEEIISVSVSSLTGNVLLRYNSGNDYQAITLLVKDIVFNYRRQKAVRDEDAVIRIHPRRSEARRIHKTVPSPKRDKTSSTALRLVKPSGKGQPALPWHLMESDAVLDLMNTSAKWGLSVEASTKHLKEYGPNVLPESFTRSPLSMFLKQFNSLPVILLGVAAGLSALMGGMVDAVVISGVVLLNATIGFVTESKAEKTISSLKRLVKPSACVIREGRQEEIPAEEVVPGDILILKPGSHITADARVIDSAHLSIDESALTGESMPVSKSAEPLKDENIPLGDRFNMVYTGTLVTGGQGRAVVVSTGRFAELGRLQALVGEARSPETPLEKQLARIGNQLVFMVGGVCVFVFGLGLLRGYKLVEILKTSISLAGAAVPEGLPTVVVTTLAFGMYNMKRHHVLIRQLGAVETLGSVQTVCFDKTGTVTLNQMSVVGVFTGMKRIKLQGNRFISDGQTMDPLGCEELQKLMHVGILCSETQLSGNGTPGIEERRYTLKGSPTENALVQMAIDAGIDIKPFRKSRPLLDVTHRSEDRLFMSTKHRTPNGGRFIALKGSPLEVLDMCSWQIRDGQKILLTEEDKNFIQFENERMAGKALRVLGMAYAEKENDENSAAGENDFIWLGLVGMADPIREGVRELIGVFHNAGIDTVMITGDQTPTAFAVGKRLNLSRGKQIEILDSAYLAQLPPDAMEALANRVHVFARVSPAHKLQIVRALQRAGKVVAMTGDGINDGPALKAADIGIAMGHTGTDIAREVADVILEKDNLETLVAALRDGRSIYENIRKSVRFFLTTNLTEIMVTFVCTAGGWGQPLNAMQFLWINTISDIFPGLALSMEPSEPDILNRPPRDPDQPIIGKPDFRRMAFESAAISSGALAAYGYGIMRYGIGARASTLAFQGLTLGQLLHAISCRSEKHGLFSEKKLESNKYLHWALGGSFVVQALSMLIPGLRSLLGTTPIGLSDAMVICAGSLLPLLVNEATKIERRENHHEKGLHVHLRVSHGGTSG